MGKADVIAFFIPHPCLPKQSCRFGRGRTYQADKVRKNARLLASFVDAHKPDSPLVGPLYLSLVFNYNWRTSDSLTWKARGLRHKDTKPDCDNLAKQLIDVMERCGFYANDSQIAALSVHKLWIGYEGVAVQLEALADA